MKKKNALQVSLSQDIHTQLVYTSSLSEGTSFIQELSYVKVNSTTKRSLRMNGISVIHNYNKRISEGL